MATPNTIACRDENGQLLIGEAISSEAAVPLSQLNSALSTVINFITALTEENYFTKEQVQSMISTINQMDIQELDVLPGEPDENIIYLIPKPDTESSKYQYVWLPPKDEVIGRWVCIGCTDINFNWINLSGKPSWITDSEPFYDYVNGIKKVSTKEFIATGTVSGGNVIFDITSGGNAVFTEIFEDSIRLEFIDSTRVHSHGEPVISGDKKQITMPITRQSFSGVTVLSVTVLGSVTMSAAPNGTVVKLFVKGK